MPRGGRPRSRLDARRHWQQYAFIAKRRRADQPRRHTDTERSTASEPSSAPIRAGALSIDPDKRLAYRDEQALALTSTEFDLLLVLARNPGRVFSRMELLDRVQGVAYEGYERTVDVHIKNLRKKIEANPRQPRYILTVYGAGYRFAEDPDG